MNTVLVTGGSKGIGSAIAEEFASLGYAVAINYNKSEEKAKALSLELMKNIKYLLVHTRLMLKTEMKLLKWLLKLRMNLEQ